MTETIAAVKERPIIFTGESVRAILDGRKTQTRRVVKPQPCNPGTFGISPIWGSGVPNGEDRFCVHAAFNEGGSRVDKWLPCPYGQPGDRLWCKESYLIESSYIEGWKARPLRFSDGRPVRLTSCGGDRFWEQCHYRATDLLPDLACEHPSHDGGEPCPHPWRNSMFMPRWASRITLEIVNVRVERVQEISEEDAKSEGVFGPPESAAGWRQHPYEACCMNSARMSFMTLWDSINGKTHPWSSDPWVWAIEFKRLEVT